MPLYKYKEMNVLVINDLNYSNFTPERKAQYPVLIDKALLDSDDFNRVLNVYPEYFQRSEEHICFNWHWFYTEIDSMTRLNVFNNVMKIVYGNEVQYLLMKKTFKYTLMTLTHSLTSFLLLI